MARTERKSDRRRREEKWQACWWCRDQQRACRMDQTSAEKLKHTGPAENERVASVPQREQFANMPEPPFSKRDRNRAVNPKYLNTREERVKVGESRTLARERGDQSGSMKR